MPGKSDPLHPGLPLWPAPRPHTHVCTFVFPLIPFLGSSGGSQFVTLCGWRWQLWTCTRPISWIALAVAGLTTVPRESNGMDQSPYMCMLFPPPLVGVGLGCVCGVSGGLCQPSPPPGLSCGLPLLLPCTVCAFISLLISFFGEWQRVVVATAQLVAVALDASWDLPMDCLSCSRGCAWGEGFGCMCSVRACVSPHPCWVHHSRPWFHVVPFPWLASSSQLRTGLKQGS
jgi:hypothetical protein